MLVPLSFTMSKKSMALLSVNSCQFIYLLMLVNHIASVMDYIESLCHELRFFDSIQKVGLRGIRTHNLVVTMHTLQPLSYLTERSGVLNGLQDQVTTKLKSSLGACSGRVRITFAANFLYFLYFHPGSELISGQALHQSPH